MSTYNRLKKGIPLILTAALIATGCGSAADTAAESTSAIAVKAVTSELGSLSVSNQFIGTVSPEQQVSIIPLVSGEIDAVYAEVGDEVSAGDVLFHINDEAARLQMENAEISKQSAELSAQRTLGSAQTLSNIQMQSNIKSLEYQVKMAQDQYDAAVSGAADAREASAELEDMIQEIEDGADELESSYAEMKKAVAMAKQCISWNGLTGWQFKSVYVWSENPDAYDWDRSEEEEEEESEGPAFTIPDLSELIPGLEAAEAAEEESASSDEKEEESEEESSAAADKTQDSASGESQAESSAGESQSSGSAGTTQTGNDTGESQPSGSAGTTQTGNDTGESQPSGSAGTTQTGSSAGETQAASDSDKNQTAETSGTEAEETKESEASGTESETASAESSQKSSSVNTTQNSETETEAQSSEAASAAADAAGTVSQASASSAEESSRKAAEQTSEEGGQNSEAQTSEEDGQNSAAQTSEEDSQEPAEQALEEEAGEPQAQSFEEAGEPEAQSAEGSGQEPEAQSAEEAEESEGGVYFSQTSLSLGSLLDGTDLAGLTPPDVFSSKEDAWAAYNAQQAIDEAERALAAMGYTADDLGEGRVDEDLQTYASQIASMQTQAATLKSNQASLESSIESADDAKESTAKAIDFYYDNLNDAVTTYQIQNGEAYQDTADALAKQIEAAELGVKSAELQLEYYSPTTPISGTVVSKSVELYGMAQPGYAAYVISSQDAMNVTFAVSGQVRESLQVGMPVTLEKDGVKYSGTITEIGATVEAQSGGLFTVKAITEADGEKLASGTAVKLTVETFRTENAVLIPYDAVHFESEQAYVFEIVDHRAVRTPVTLGLMNEDTVEVTEGLEAGSQVVATWSSQLEDGAAVRIIGESQTEGSSAADAAEARDVSEGEAEE